MQIPKRVWEDMTDQLMSELPREGCGVLAGTPGTVRFIKLRNMAGDEAHFCVSPHEWVPLMHALEEQNDSLLAIVHSHPYSKPVPSREDLAGFFYPDVRMLIVSFLDPYVPQAALYRIEGRQFEPCYYEII